MKVLARVPEVLWESVANQCPWATFFHTPTWASFLTKAFPQYEVATKAFGFEDGSWVILPMMQSERECKGFFRTMTSNVLGVYGGFIAKKPMTAHQTTKIASYLESVRAKRVDIFGNPYAGDFAGFEAWEKKPNFTHRLDISRFADEEALKRHYGHLIRKQIKDAFRVGYTFKQVENLQEVTAYYGIYQKALERWGTDATGRREFSFFRTLFESHCGNAVWWIAIRDGRVVGGLLSFVFNNIWVAWHSAFLDEEFPLGLAKYMHHHGILDAKARGCRYYDFNPSGGHEGTVRFKDMFGAERAPFVELRWRHNNVYRWFRNVRELLPDKKTLETAT